MQPQTIESGTTFGAYTIEGLIAGGGMGAVYAARHQVYGSPVALKILHTDLHRDAQWRRRFNEEGLVGTQLKHPHLLSARELIMEPDGRVALVLDLVSGGLTLLRVMSREFPRGLPLVQALQVLLGLIQGVEYAHDKGVVHGDIKPENVLIQGDFRDPSTWIPKLTDFGTVGILAIPVVIDGQAAVVVSPRYASPEHIKGMDHLERRSDIYCLGLLLHYLLTGEHASNAASVPEAADAVVKPVPSAKLLGVPDPVVALFARAVQVDPDARYQSCREFALAVRAVLDALGAELDLDDLQADLATEVDEERRRQRAEQIERERAIARENAARDPMAEPPPDDPEDIGWLDLDSPTLGLPSPVGPGKAPMTSPEHTDQGLVEPGSPEALRASGRPDATDDEEDDSDEDTADQINPFDGRTLHERRSDPEKATEVPPESRGDAPNLADLDDTHEPPPLPDIRAPRPEPRGFPVWAVVGGVVLAAVIGAIVVMNWPG